MNYLATCGYVIQSGRGFVKDDYKNYNKVALIDDNAAQNLFPSQNPVGQTVEINQNHIRLWERSGRMRIISRRSTVLTNITLIISQSLEV